MDEGKLRQLRWRCRRGMKEVELVLIPFFDNVFKELNEVEQRQFEVLLECPDPDLLAWLSHKGQPEEPELQQILQIIFSSMKQ